MSTMEHACKTCAFWVDKIGLYGETWLSNHSMGDGWKLCAYSANEGSISPREGQLALAIECEDVLAVLATAPEYGCNQWNPKR